MFVFAQQGTQCHFCGMSLSAYEALKSDSDLNFASKTSVSGMSLSEANSHLQMDVTQRQFRRYVEAGVIDSKSVGKNSRGWWVLINPPTNPAEWNQLADKIQKWREERFKRGWKKRPRKQSRAKSCLNAKDRSVGLVTIEGVHMEFNLWLRKVTEDGFPFSWNESRLKKVESLLRPIVQAYVQTTKTMKEQGIRPLP